MRKDILISFISHSIIIYSEFISCIRITIHQSRVLHLLHFHNRRSPHQTYQHSRSPLLRPASYLSYYFTVSVWPWVPSRLSPSGGRFNLTRLTTILQFFISCRRFSTSKLALFITIMLWGKFISCRAGSSGFSVWLPVRMPGIYSRWQFRAGNYLNFESCSTIFIIDHLIYIIMEIIK